MIKDYIEKSVVKLDSYTHYLRSKFSPDCSSGETEKEKSTEMLEKKDVIDWHTSQQKGLIQKVVEMADGMKEKREHEGFCEACNYRDEYNQALSDLKAKLLQEIE